MKDFYEFLNHNYNFFGFIVCLAIVVTGLREIVKALRGTKSQKKKQTEQ